MTGLTNKIITSILFLVFSASSFAAQVEPLAATAFLDIDPISKRIELKISLSKAVHKLRFAREAPEQMRINTWEVSAPLKIDSDSRSDFIVATNGSEFRILTLRLPFEFQKRPRFYELVKSISSKSTVIYTGYFLLASEESGGVRYVPMDLEARAPNLFWLADESGARQMRGKWRHDTDEGAYILVSPQATDLQEINHRLVKIFANQQTLAQFGAGVPQLISSILELYERRLRATLPGRPIVLLTADEGRTFRVRGSTNRGVLFVSLTRDPTMGLLSQAQMNELRYVIAHELAHLWNEWSFHADVGRLSYTESGDVWLWEGGADALAYEALLELGFMNWQKYREIFANAMGYCIASLNVKVVSPEGYLHLSNPNECGHVFSVLGSAAMVKNDEHRSSLNLWAKVFDFARKRGNKYSKNEFFKSIEDVGGSRSDFLPRVAYSMHQMDWSGLVRANFERLGVAIDVHPWRAEVAGDLLASVTGRLQAADCGGRIGYSLLRSEAAVHLQKRKNCTRIIRDYRMDVIAGVPLKRGYASALKAMAIQCANRGRVKMIDSRSSQSLELPCSSIDVNTNAVVPYFKSILSETF